jgi:ankyrin repeat protein
MKAIAILILVAMVFSSCGPRVDELQCTAGEGNRPRVARLLDSGSDVNAVDSNGWTALHRAADGGHDESVQLLLERGANVNAKTPDGQTPLHRASVKGHNDTVRILLTGNADAHARTNSKATALMLGAGHPEVIESLLASGATKE